MIRVFTAFSGYDSQCLALNVLMKSENFPPETQFRKDGATSLLPIPFIYELVGWSEIDKFAIQAHNALFPQWADRNYGDISKIDWSTVPDFDLFTYSSPYQDFSQAGKQAGATKGSGTRSSLLWECERAIETKRPKYLLFENVAAVCSSKFIRLFNEWQLTLERMGYTNFAQVLNAKTHGYPAPVPQNRERLFMVSILDCTTLFYFPDPQPLTQRLVDVLEKDIPDEYYLNEKAIQGFQRRYGEDYKYNPQEKDCAVTITRREDSQCGWSNYLEVLGWTRDAKGEVVDRHPVEVANAVTAAKRDNTQNYVVIPANTAAGEQTMELGGVCDLSYPGSKTRRGRVQENGTVSPTLTTHTENCLRRIESHFRIRKLTPRECFRLMGVSDADIDNIQAAGISKSQQYKMAGNSIVVNTLAAIFRQLLIGNFNKAQQTEIF